MVRTQARELLFVRTVKNVTDKMEEIFMQVSGLELQPLLISKLWLHHIFVNGKPQKSFL
jgi:hypothetical protein